METQERELIPHPAGEPPAVEVRAAIADTFAGRIHIEWAATAPVTPFGQLPFFIDYLKQAGLFDTWVADCPLSLTSPNAPTKRDLLGTVLLSVLAGHRRYAHITTLCCDALTPPLARHAQGSQRGFGPPWLGGSTIGGACSPAWPIRNIIARRSPPGRYCCPPSHAKPNMPVK